MSVINPCSRVVAKARRKLFSRSPDALNHVGNCAGSLEIFRDKFFVGQSKTVCLLEMSYKRHDFHGIEEAGFHEAKRAVERAGRQRARSPRTKILNYGLLDVVHAFAFPSNANLSILPVDPCGISCRMLTSAGTM